ncbi:hypothetical protein [Desulfococcus sp.]|uniref:hypothetical protein n=1 Tax=Desulfococcus sp. TaxID=2025834 RepID=UPI00359329D5
MRRISREVIFERGDGGWTGDRHLKTTGELLAHIKTAHTEDGHVTGCMATIAFMKKGGTDQVERCKAFFPPLLDGKNLLAAIEKNLCPFCEIERAEQMKAVCLANGQNGRGPVYTPENSNERYEIDAAGRLLRWRKAAFEEKDVLEWFDFKKGFWFEGPGTAPPARSDR